jgi:phosphomannomutase
MPEHLHHATHTPAPIRFGTDGWRAVIAEDFTFANVERVAQATAEFWSAPSGNPRPDAPTVVIGYDRRFLSEQFAARTAEVMAGNGFQVVLTSRPTPTPAVSWAVKTMGAVGGVMITASHNPAVFNGFKLKASYGGSADAETSQGVERLLDRAQPRKVPLDEALRAKRIRLRDLIPPHLEAVRSRIDFRPLRRRPLEVAHDALYGVGAGCFERLLEHTRCRVRAFNDRPDPSFGGLSPEPIPANYGATAHALARQPADVCLVTDGDADRLGAMDGRGRPLSTHQLICLVLQHLRTRRHASGRVVKALTTTSMLDKMCAAYGLELTETSVGFKYIAAEMLKGGVLLGAEESGGIGFPEHLPERDGLLAGMVILEALATERVPISRLIQRLERAFGPHRYARRDIHFPIERRQALVAACIEAPPTRLLRSPVDQVKSADGVKFIARNGAWLMLRGSGTEPVLRIYAEADSDAAARRLVQFGARQARAFASVSAA